VRNRFLDSDGRPIRIDGGTTNTTLESALRRVLAEIGDGLRHGHFEFTLRCEVVTRERRRLTLHAGKSHQFLIAKEDCLRSASPDIDFRDGSDTNVT
jgi:hypothetical protein